MFLGGLITEYLSWPWVFFINIPIALVAIVATGKLMPAGTGARRGSIDGGGGFTVTAGIGAAVYGIVRAPEVGWSSPQTWGVLAAAVARLGLFVVIQARRAQPLVRLSIFRRHRQHELPARLRSRPGRHHAVAASMGATRIDNPAVLTDGFSGAFLGAGLIAAAGAVIAAITLHLPRPQRPGQNVQGTDLATTGGSR